MRRVRIAFLLLLTVLLAEPLAWCIPVPLPRPQQRASRHAIELLENAWRNAILQRDAATLDSLMGREYMAITAEGTLLSREKTLEWLRDGTLNYLSYEVSDRKYRFYGSTAVVTSRADVRRRGPEGEISGSYFDTRVYVRESPGKWKIVHFEVSRILDPQDK